MSVRRSVPRAIGAAAIVCLSLLAPVGGAGSAPPASAQEGSEPDPGALRIADTTPFVPADGVFSFTVDASDLRPTDELAWTVHSLVPEEPESIVTALTDQPGPPLRAEERLTIGELELLAAAESPSESDAEGTSVNIPVRSQSTGSDRVYLPDAGIYPVSVRLVRQDETIGATVLPLIRLAENPTGEGRFVHLTTTVVGDPALQLDGTVGPSEDDLEALGALADQLSALPDPDERRPVLSVSMPAELIDSLARSADPDDADLVDRLAGVADRATWLSTPYVPLDLGAWAAADVARNPALSLSYDTAARRSADLLGVEVNTALIPPDPTLAAPAVGFLADRGAVSALVDPAAGTLDDLPTTPFTLVGTWAAPETRPERVSERPGDDLTPTTQRTLPALAVQEFDPAIVGDPTAVEADDVARELALLSIGEDGGVATLRLPGPMSGDALGSLLSALDAAEGVVTPIDAEALTFGLSQTEATASEVTPAGATSLQLGPLELATYRAQQSINAAAGLDADDPRLVLAQRQALVAPHQALTAEDAEAYALSARGAAQSMLDSISLGDISAITLAARQSNVPFRFQNDLDGEVTVLLRVRSDRLRLTDADDQGRLTLTVPPGRSTSEVSVEVVTSGVFTVTADVLTPTGGEIIERQEFQVRSRAFSGVGVALSVASLIVLGLWWARTAHAKRRADREHPTGR